MSDNGRLLDSWFAVWNSHELDRLRALVAPDYVHHTMGGDDLDIAGFDAGFRGVISAFPDVRYEIVHLIEQGPMAAVYLRSTATHAGAYLGVPPTGKAVTVRGTYHCRIADGRIAEDWDVFDLLTPALRLGASITPG